MILPLRDACCSCGTARFLIVVSTRIFLIYHKVEREGRFNSSFNLCILVSTQIAPCVILPNMHFLWQRMLRYPVVDITTTSVSGEL
jgi:hypothetical protein